MKLTHQPVVRTILADLLTPVALYDRLAGAPYPTCPNPSKAANAGRVTA